VLLDVVLGECLKVGVVNGKRSIISKQGFEVPCNVSRYRL
jgi:hypothetical protein